MSSIFGSMVVKNGIKQVIYNFSNARKKTYAQVQAMSDAEKQGVIICDDYPVSSAYGSYEKIANGTTLDELKAVLKGMNYIDAWSTCLVITASDENGGAYILRPLDARANMRQYIYVRAPYNSENTAKDWLLVYNGNNDSIRYYEQTMTKNGSWTSTEPTVSAWELYRLKV